MKRPGTILFFCFVLFAHCFSQQYTFSNYSINDGLSQSVINCVFQDSLGYIWLGTQNGLNRFNGETFDIYRFNPSDTNSITNNWIYAISEDHDGNLWIGTKGGLFKYFQKQNVFRQINYQANFMHDVTVHSYDNICLNNGNILINTPPVISIYDTKKDIFSHFRSNLDYDGAVKDVKIPVIEDRDGGIWIGSAKGLSRFSLRTEEFSYFSFAGKNGNRETNVNVSALFQDKKEMLWAGTSSGLFKYNSELNTFEIARFKTSSSEEFIFEDYTIKTILEDKNDNLLIGTEASGLFVISEPLSDTAKIQNYTQENSTIRHNNVQSLLIDNSDNLWIGTLNGISKTDLKKSKFQLYRNSDSPNSINLLGNVIAGLYKNDDGIIWVGNWGQGLNLVNRETNEVEHFSTNHTGNHYFPNDFVHDIYKDNDGLIWLGTRDGILIYDKPQHQFVRWNEYFNSSDLPTFRDTRIYMILQDKASNHWIATSNGLYKINLDQGSVERFKAEFELNHQISANLIHAILEDSEGLIWIGTINGLDVYDPVTRTLKHFSKESGLNHDFIISLCEDSEGQIWIGTNAYINRYNKKDGSFTYFNEEHGLPSNYIYVIRKDKNNDMWFGTGRGLCKFNKKDRSFNTFTQEDGLQSLEFNLRAACVCDDGELFFGGMNGFNSFYPDSISKNPHKPKLVFTSFYKTIGESKEYINLGELDEVVLDYNENSFTVEFAALEFTNPQKNNYAYKMEGIYDNWMDIGNRRFVPFFALSPGKYNFKIIGSNNDDEWNTDAIGIKIIIRPPWWRSILAYVVYLIVIVLSVFVFIKIRERRLQQDKIILEQKVTERTLQIEEQNQLITTQNEKLKELNSTKDKLFSIIGHDLGNQFNIIVGFLDVLVSDFKRLAADKLELHLKNIYDTSKHANDLLENLLTWAKIQRNAIQYHPKEFKVKPIIEESLGLLQSAAAKKNITVQVIANPETIIYADVNMFSTVIRNLTYNAIKFTHENGEVSISVKNMQKFCQAIVKDNGVGIPKENIQKIFRVDSKLSTKGTNGEKGTGLGLIVVKEFIEKHNGKIWVESEVGKGSEFKITLPLESA
jgi:ligand-binding sensor domain-containing protein/signal transduction histidine kinase